MSQKYVFLHQILVAPPNTYAFAIRLPNTYAFVVFFLKFTGKHIRVCCLDTKHIRVCLFSYLYQTHSTHIPHTYAFVSRLVANTFAFVVSVQQTHRVCQVSQASLTKHIRVCCYFEQNICNTPVVCQDPRTHATRKKFAWQPAVRQRCLQRPLKQPWLQSYFFQPRVANACENAQKLTFLGPVNMHTKRTT